MLELTIDRLRLKYVDGAGHEHRGADCCPSGCAAGRPDPRAVRRGQ